MSSRWRHPIHGLPFDEPIAEALAEEFAEQPWARRAQALRKAAFRELVMLASGQSRRRVDRVPAGVGAILWVYTWRRCSRPTGASAVSTPTRTTRSATSISCCSMHCARPRCA
jgi:hypothetical protein